MIGIFMERLLEMTWTGTVLILAVLVLRLAMKRMPKAYTCGLWILVLIRLLCPVTIPSPFSLLPVSPEPLVQVEAGGTTMTMLETGIPSIDVPVNVVLFDSFGPGTGSSADPMQIFLTVSGLVWLLGFLIFAGGSVYRYRRFRRLLRSAVPGGDGAYYTENISMPMVAGIRKPRIYLPELLLLDENREEREFVMAHEAAHIRRKDHVLKFAAFAALAVHWFNPFMWLAFLLLGRDIEMACDESVMRTLGEDRKKGYSMALLRFAERRSGLLIPLAFGESSIKSRIKNILKYKKPQFWLSLAAVLILALFAAAFLTDPDSAGTVFFSTENGTQVIGGADGPTSVFVAGKTEEEASGGDKAISVIGGADGPTSVFIAGKTAGEGSPAAHMDVEAAKALPHGQYVELDYVSTDKISLHGTFGYMVFEFGQKADGSPEMKVLRAVDLSETGPIVMAGDGYTEVFAGEDAAVIIPEAFMPGTEEKNFYMYDEKEDTLFDGGTMPVEFWEKLKDTGDALVDYEAYPELLERVRERGTDSLLYGPAAVPELDAEVYGFLAADGELLEDVWYGLWRRGTEKLEKIPLFETEKPGK